MLPGLNFLSRKKQIQINALWNSLSAPKMTVALDDFSAIENVIKKISEDCGVDFLYSSISIGDLEELAASRYCNDHNELSSLLFSTIANSCYELKSAVDLYRKKHPKSAGGIFCHSSYQTSDTCNMLAISFVVYATIARNLATVCDKDWGSGTAALVAECLGYLSLFPKFNAHMDMIFSCIFDHCICPSDVPLCVCPKGVLVHLRQDKSVEKEEDDVKSNH